MVARDNFAPLRVKVYQVDMHRLFLPKKSDLSVCSIFLSNYFVSQYRLVSNSINRLNIHLSKMIDKMIRPANEHAPFLFTAQTMKSPPCFSLTLNRKTEPKSEKLRSERNFLRNILLSINCSNFQRKYYFYSKWKIIIFEINWK